MERDMELIRNILFAIEEQYIDIAIYNLKINGYDFQTVAYHCKLLYENHLISNYNDEYADGKIYNFGVGSLTWEGHDYLEKIRNDTIWNNTKKTIVSRGLPFTIEVVKEITSTFISGMVQGVIKGIK